MMINFVGNLLTTPVFWVLIAIAALITWNRYEHIKRKAVYSIVLKGTYDISEISSTLQMDYKAVEKRLKKLIAFANSPKEKVNKKWISFNDAYIDYQRKRIVLSGSSTSSDNAPLLLSTDKGGHMEIITCSGCGSQNTVIHGGTAKCEYCGVTLVSEKSLITPQVVAETQPVVMNSSPAQPINVHVTVNNTPTSNEVIQSNIPSNVVSNKKRSIALLLCLFLGFFGGHLFYAGRVGKGVLYIFTIGLFFFGVVIDFLIILSGTFKDKSGKPMKMW